MDRTCGPAISDAGYQDATLGAGYLAGRLGVTSWASCAILPGTRTMKLRTLLVSTALIAAATAPLATAQSTGSVSRTKKAPPPIATSRPKTSHARKWARRYLPPPPPPPMVSTRSAGRRASRDSSPFGSLVKDPTGRIDKSGRPVAFYPSVRSMNGAGRQASATREAKSAAIQENPQKDPYKSPITESR